MNKWRFLKLFLVLIIFSAAVTMPFITQSESNLRSPLVTITDPIFEVSFDSRKVHFELIETRFLMKSCNKFHGIYKYLPPRLSIYAQYKRDATSIYIVDSDEGIEESVFIIRDGICNVDDTQFAILQIPRTHNGKASLTDTEVTGLIEDALIRYEKAFGGKAIFLKLLEGTIQWGSDSCKDVPKGVCLGVRPLKPFILKIMREYRNTGTGLNE